MQLLKASPCYLGSRYPALNLTDENLVIRLLEEIIDDRSARSNLSQSSEESLFGALPQKEAERLYRKALHRYSYGASRFLQHFPQVSEEFLRDIGPILAEKDPTFYSLPVTI